MMVLDRYPMQPHKCFKCGSTRTPCVDTERDWEDSPIHLLEHVYLCFECVLDAARSIGPRVGFKVMPTADVDAADSILSEAMGMLNAEVEAHNKTKDALHSLMAAGYSLTSGNGSAVLEVVTGE